MARTWTPIDGDPRFDNESYYEKIKAQADGLAMWWSQLHDAGEQEGWRRQTAWENGDYEPGVEYPMRSWFPRTPEGDAEYTAECQAVEAELQAFEDERRARDEMQRAQIDFIEAQLEALGCRMMRPYEHWNEDEAYMAWAERER